MAHVTKQLETARSVNKGNMVSTAMRTVQKNVGIERVTKVTEIVQKVAMTISKGRNVKSV